MRFLVYCITTLCLACGDDGTTTPTEAKWTLIENQRVSSLLGIWGANASDVWVAGADERDGSGPTVLHFDGTAWTRVPTGETGGDLWWVFGVGDSVFFGGSRGVMLEYRGGTFKKLVTPNTNVVFGIWGSAPDDVWAVGGLPGGTGAFVWHYDGSAVTARADLPAELAMGTVWKVTGCAANDVYMSSTSGIVLRHDGGPTLVREDVGSGEESLFSAACSQGRVVAVGGNTTNGALYERDAAGTWTLRTPTVDGPVLRGVAHFEEHAYAVGQFGAVLRRDGSRWIPDSHGLTTESLHAAWIDPDGGLWAVGGKFDRAQPSDGVMLYRGTVDVPLVE